MNRLTPLVRPNIQRLVAYTSAREQFMDYQLTLLDANENPENSIGTDSNPHLLNRYPDPAQLAVKEALSELNGHPSDAIVLGNGSDEIIDLLIRIFCEPSKDRVLITTPTYGMYRVSADINDVEVDQASLTDDFDLDVEATLAAITPNTKIIFLCSPNNPTGNLLSRAAIENILQVFKGVVVIDEAYIDFAEAPSARSYCEEYANLLVMQTFSKSWGLAGIRLGVGYTSKDLAHFYNRIKPPYNINQLTQQQALKALQNSQELTAAVDSIVEQREWLKTALDQITMVKHIYPSEANFLLVKFANPDSIFDYLIQKEIIVRNRSNVHKCEGCLRITVGTHSENQKLIQALKAYRS
jgi:histidinol-phosphate aminotransferase